MVGNPDLARALGIPVARYASATFVVGTCLAGLAGVLIAPLVPVQPFMGLDHILMSFFVLVVGGLGSVGGLLTGSAVIGGANSVVSALSDSTGGYFSVLALAILFLWLQAARHPCAQLTRRDAACRCSSAPAPRSSRCSLLPFAVGDFWAYQLGLLYLYAIAALGIGLCWGRAGFLPLGQGLFFGLAAYLSGLALIALRGESVAVAAADPARRLRLGPARVRDRHAGLSPARRKRSLLLDDHARARRCSPTRSPTTGSR